jgi:glycerol-3-phosphate acyltransferase PlsY
MPDPISWEFAWPYLLAALAGGYFLGSIPFGLVLTRLAGLGDLRSIGSRNIGATNVLRTGRKDLALLTLILDGGKGAGAAWIGWYVGGPDTMLVAGLGAVLGHNFPVWLGFHGGKGVATSIALMLLVAWPAGLALCATWLLVAAVTRYSSLAALLGFLLTPVYVWYLVGDLQRVEFAAILAALILLRHHGNIRRLLRGEETKIGGKKDRPEAG